MRTTNQRNRTLRVGPVVVGAAMVCLALATGCPPTEFTLDMEELTAEEGLSLRIPAFEVPYGEEVQDCYFMEVPDLNGDGSDIWIGRSLVGMNPGSHHFNIHRVTTETELRMEDGVDFDMGGTPTKLVKGGPCFDSSNFNEWPLVVNSQTSTEENPYLDWTLPEGVAFRLTPGEILMLQPHYVNISHQDTPYMGRVYINFYRDEETDPVELGTLFGTQQSIRVCQSSPDSTYYGTCAFPAADNIRIAAINGHFHLRGERFSIATWDGVSLDPPPEEDEFYLSYSWEDPVMDVNLDIPVEEGGGIWWTCEYEWREPATGCDIVNSEDDEQQGDCCYTFGPHVEYQEHCNIFLYYWPKQESGDIFCN